MHILKSKLKNLKNKLKVWNKQVFGNVHSFVIEAEQNLSNIQNQIHTTGHTDELLNQERMVHITLDQALTRQNIFWQEKSRVSQLAC